MDNKAIFNGLLMGGASIIVTLLLYFINPKMMLSSGSWLMFLIFIVFMVRAVKDERAFQGGFISFSEGLKAAFLAYVVGGLLYHLFNYVLIAVIDTSLAVILREISMEAIDKLSSFMDGDQIDEAKDLLEDQSFVPTLGGSLMNYMVSVIFGFIVALIIAAIMKKEDKGFA